MGINGSHWLTTQWTSPSWKCHTEDDWPSVRFVVAEINFYTGWEGRLPPQFRYQTPMWWLKNMSTDSSALFSSKGGVWFPSPTLQWAKLSDTLGMKHLLQYVPSSFHLALSLLGCYSGGSLQPCHEFTQVALGEALVWKYHGLLPTTVSTSI